MRHPVIAIAVLSLLFCATACSNKSSSVDSNVPDSVFSRLSKEYIKGYLAWRPQLGTYLGLHEYDGKIKDYSRPSLDAEVSRLKEYLEQTATYSC